MDTQRQAVEVYQRVSEKIWALRSFGPDDQVELASLGVSFPVAAVYEDVMLPEDTTDDEST